MHKRNLCAHRLLQQKVEPNTLSDLTLQLEVFQKSPRPPLILHLVSQFTRQLRVKLNTVFFPR